MRLKVARLYSGCRILELRVIGFILCRRLASLYVSLLGVGEVSYCFDEL